jgi:aldehyde dehydrogenase (NAD+)
LGGKSAHIVLDDADFSRCLPMPAVMACVMSGQSCILPSRILLPRHRYDEGLQVLKATMENFPVGDPWNPGNMQGPQISETQRQKVLGLIQSGIESGATVVTGGGITSPFGGTKQSGLGRRNGDQAFKEYVEIKTIGLPA